MVSMVLGVLSGKQRRSVGIETLDWLVNIKRSIECYLLITDSLYGWQGDWIRRITAVKIFDYDTYCTIMMNCKSIMVNMCRSEIGREEIEKKKHLYDA